MTPLEFEPNGLSYMEHLNQIAYINFFNRFYDIFIVIQTHAHMGMGGPPAFLLNDDIFRPSPFFLRPMKNPIFHGILTEKIFPTM